MSDGLSIDIGGITVKIEQDKIEEVVRRNIEKMIAEKTREPGWWLLRPITEKAQERIAHRIADDQDINKVFAIVASHMDKDFVKSIIKSVVLEQLGSSWNGGLKKLIDEVKDELVAKLRLAVSAGSVTATSDEKRLKDARRIMSDILHGRLKNESASDALRAFLEGTA